MTRPARGRMTQKQIAELAGVSQATVSLVLNGREGNGVRIPEETRQRVLEVINSTIYVADPAARRLAGVGNKILGVFTYEPAFPNESVDFYTPLLMGIESEAEKLGSDLLIFTSAAVEDGHRHIFQPNNRIGLADGCLLLGREIDREDLVRLVAEDYPFVAIGRREVDGVPYVGVDYAGATASLARIALERGHRRFLYFHVDSDSESVRDRREGLVSAVGEATDASLEFRVGSPEAIEEAVAVVAARRVTVVFVEDPALAEEFARAVEAAGLSVPRDVSIVVLGDTARLDPDQRDFTRLQPPRSELGRRATILLDELLSSGKELPGERTRILLDCPIALGATLAEATESAE
ncbi:LacI family DNA-binding transcriptional regulator [Gryllotalpicola koreensis]|uniref:LacI family DNA-binding transcriptional regulator n=1 Tax=Gryllotalpicola koreensis TaxID=993086 RepID=A0ABP8A0T3_9MICO